VSDSSFASNVIRFPSRGEIALSKSQRGKVKTLAPPNQYVRRSILRLWYERRRGIRQIQAILGLRQNVVEAVIRDSSRPDDSLINLGKGAA